jgi:hypothetical protein
MDRSGLMSATTATSVLGIAANENEARAVMGSRLLFGRSHKKSNVASAAFGLPVGGVALVLLLAILCSSGPNHEKLAGPRLDLAQEEVRATAKPPTISPRPPLSRSGFQRL